MSTAAIETTRTHIEATQAARLAAQLRAAHHDVTRLVPELDFDDAQVWTEADPVVTQVSAQAYGVAATLTGQARTPTAVGVPPVVRVRELVSAQRRTRHWAS